MIGSPVAVPQPVIGSYGAIIQPAMRDVLEARKLNEAIEIKCSQAITLYKEHLSESIQQSIANISAPEEEKFESTVPYH